MSEDWIVGNQIREKLKNGPSQPFYHVLLQDNHIPRCVSQENVALDRDSSTTNFDHYAMPYYFETADAVTDELAFCYPSDGEFRCSGGRDYRSLEEAHLPPYAEA